jgi:phosphoglycerate dehydrogenase-like enzyme
MRLLVNLPDGFFTHPDLTAIFARLSRLGDVRCTSHNSADEIAPDLAWAEAVILWSWPAYTAELLDRAPDLKYSGHIDITQRGARVALERGLPVSVSRHGFSPAVAEMALALILATLRRITDHQAQMRAGTETWVARFPTDIDPQERELSGRSIGLIGFGNVGRRLVRLLAPFGNMIRIYDPFVTAEMFKGYNVTQVELHEMLRESEVVVLCAASNAGTKHILGAAEIELLRPHAVLVNVARAALVDTPALTARLERGDLYAALDVFDKEPLEADSPLRSLPNAYLTPHRAGGIIASVQRNLTWLVDDLVAVFAGQERRHALTEAMLPSLDA